MGLVGNQITETDEQGEPIVGDSFLLVFNAHHEDVTFQAGRMMRRDWDVVLDTSSSVQSPRRLNELTELRVPARSMQVLKVLPRREGTEQVKNS